MGSFEEVGTLQVVEAIQDIGKTGIIFWAALILFYMPVLILPAFAGNLEIPGAFDDVSLYLLIHSLIGSTVSFAIGMVRL